MVNTKLLNGVSSILAGLVMPQADPATGGGAPPTPGVGYCHLTLRRGKVGSAFALFGNFLTKLCVVLV